MMYVAYRPCGCVQGFTIVVEVGNSEWGHVTAVGTLKGETK